jgi:predicted transcriptional regulator
MSAHRPPPLPDFARITRSLHSRDIRSSVIARKLHVSPSCVHHWLMGDRMPIYTNGSRRLFLAEKSSQRE